MINFLIPISELDHKNFDWLPLIKHWASTSIEASLIFQARFDSWPLFVDTKQLWISEPEKSFS